MKIRSIPGKTVIKGIIGRGRGGRTLMPEVFKKPKKWVYETKPVFKRVKKPLVDVFKEAEEVRIIIDLGGFKRGEVDIDIKRDRYVITAIGGGEAFREEILIPMDVDVENTEEHFKNGILELVLPRKKEEK